MEKVEKIVVLDNEIQALLLDSALTDRNIPHVLRSYHDSACDGLFQNSKGWGHIEAPVNFKEEILAILKDLEQNNSIHGNDVEKDL